LKKYVRVVVWILIDRTARAAFSSSDNHLDTSIWRVVHLVQCQIKDFGLDYRHGWHVTARFCLLPVASLPPAKSQLVCFQSLAYRLPRVSS
jgi:hypothetical protein